MRKLIGQLKSYFSNKRDITAVYLFGSHAKGRSNLQSDIDIAVLYKKNVKRDLFNDSLKISCDLMERLSCNKVDVVVLNSANPILKNQVYKYGVKVLCKDPVAAVRFKAASILEYLDFSPVRRPSELALKRA